MKVEMNEGRSHRGILGVRRRGSQTHEGEQSGQQGHGIPIPRSVHCSVRASYVVCGRKRRETQANSQAKQRVDAGWSESGKGET